MAKYPSQLQDKFNLRLPDGMKDAIAERAEKNGRSMNSEIVQILHDAISGGISLPMDKEFARIYKEVTERDACDERENLSQEDFDSNNEKIDWLIDKFMERIESDSQKFRNLLTMKKSLSENK
ncbi:TPA: Arc family DNA-binding protein [Morganella morganii]|uniref:Arc family DNA-binding protein n=1 Tax=Morganella morganii TaxID=582 RepID=UPI001B95BBBC|nr:Arc family DNA-binding protein [Morganella morganii]MCF1264284.1 Arc family DNA-binding protein [Morganella morganii]HBC7443495.1 Arc family DNA-binding protein [Morganella morganii]HDF2344062.1 Arc family DNA-binding protein [Morganella morganii]HDF2366518.1 Arc family DNA-binding protein [Morganella morganii]HDF2424616.1 Arc family DNA-binding protein [Morganella morganii]